MRKGFAAILLAICVAMGGAGITHAEGQKGGQSGSSNDGSGGSGGAARNSPFEPISVQGWDGGAYRDSKDTVYCELYDDYGNGAELLVGWDKYGFYLLITDPNTLKLEPWADFETTVSVDKLYRAKVKAFAYDTDLLELYFGTDRKAINALRKGDKMVLEEWDHWYTLHGTGAAIDAIEACYNRHL
jgi:hypothetical protein